MKRLIVSIVLLVPVLMSFFAVEEKSDLDLDTPLVDILEMLGQPKPNHYLTPADSVKIEIGRQLVLDGQAKIPGGGRTRAISRFFICTDCHNQVQEDPVLGNFDPEARLDYAIEHDLPFLQATTFWGITNRETWYNDDYFLKYGELVAEARNSLKESTQLCAIECSSGRELKDWELECILQYYRTLELKLDDVKLTASELDELSEVIEDPVRHKEARDYIKQKFATYSPANFVEPPSPLIEGYKIDRPADVERGKEIYDRSCKTCHTTKKCSQFILDDATVTFKKLVNNLDKHTFFNLYKIIRKGTYAQPGHK
ncbi:MAG: hypothetical protein ACI84C_000184, partial [Flavobacteriales bacterium]